MYNIRKRYNIKHKDRMNMSIDEYTFRWLDRKVTGPHITCVFYILKFFFNTKPYKVITHQNHLFNTILMSGHLIGLGEEINIFFQKYVVYACLS